MHLFHVFNSQLQSLITFRRNMTSTKVKRNFQERAILQRISFFFESIHQTLKLFNPVSLKILFGRLRYRTKRKQKAGKAGKNFYIVYNLTKSLIILKGYYLTFAKHYDFSKLHLCFYLNINKTALYW